MKLLPPPGHPRFRCNNEKDNCIEFKAPHWERGPVWFPVNEMDGVMREDCGAVAAMAWRKEQERRVQKPSTMPENMRHWPVDDAPLRWCKEATEMAAAWEAFAEGE